MAQATQEEVNKADRVPDLLTPGQEIGRQVHVREAAAEEVEAAVEEAEVAAAEEEVVEEDVKISCC